MFKSINTEFLYNIIEKLKNLKKMINLIFKMKKLEYNRKIKYKY